MQNRNMLFKFSNMVRKYVETEEDFKFIEAPDVKFAFSSRKTVVCLLNIKNISATIPADQFDEWFENLVTRLHEAFDEVNVRRAGENIVFDIVPTEEFLQKADDRTFLNDVGTYTAAILETIDGAVIDDWGDDGEEVDSPYYV